MAAGRPGHCVLLAAASVACCFWTASIGAPRALAPGPRLGPQPGVRPWRRRPLSRVVRGCSGRGDASFLADGELAADVRWLPPLATNQRELTPSKDPNVTVLGVFPLPGWAFPNQTHELSIFEPRYRKLYNDILVSGSRRFVVVGINPEDGRLGEAGVVFYLDDLRDVSAKTDDEVKYVCQHSIIGRVRIQRILNPAAWEDQSTYLRAETVPLEDEGVGEDTAAMERDLAEKLQSLAALQDEVAGVSMDDDIALFVEAVDCQDPDLWTVADVWCSYLDNLLAERRDQLEQDVELKYFGSGDEVMPFSDINGIESIPFVDKDEEDGTDDAWDGEEFDEVQGFSPPGMSSSRFSSTGEWGAGFGDVPSSQDVDDPAYYDDSMEEDYVDLLISDAPPGMQAELRKLQGQFTEEALELEFRQALLTARLMQSTSHKERLHLLLEEVQKETRQLSARRALEIAVREGQQELVRPMPGPAAAANSPTERRAGTE